MEDQEPSITGMNRERGQITTEVPEGEGTKEVISEEISEEIILIREIIKFRIKGKEDTKLQSRVTQTHEGL